ncbi:MAG TPA: glycosyltransferase family 4 protein [Thermoanaerobaculia bacterium]|nr:glycosyltransferase family 4 protein [Thermoanaerobaculia bacterium]
MRLAYVCADAGVPVFGRKGCSIHVQEVLRAFLRRGIEVDLFAARFGGKPPAALERVRVHPLPEPTAGDAVSRERQALEANRFLEGALRRSGPFDVLYERYSLWSFAGIEYARRTGLPGILEVNAPLIEEHSKYRGLSDRDAAEKVAGRCFAAAGVIVAVSEGVAATLERHPAARGRIRVVPNGVDPGRFRPDIAPAAPAPPGVFTVGFVGSLKPWHGISTLVEAFARFRESEGDARLLVVGDGPERRTLDAEVSERGLAAFTRLTGPVDPEEVPRFLVSMDAAVAPYPSDASFYFSPLKVYEYMAAGLPVIASAVGQLADLLEEGRCGILCTPGDPAEFAEALVRLRRDPDLRRRLGRDARARVLRECTWDMVAERLLEAATPAAVAEGR